MSTAGVAMDAVDGDKLKQFLKQSGQMVAAGFNCAVTVLGDRLDLYAELARGGAASPQELADRCGLHERWVREWLYHQACIGQLEYQEGRFSISPEAHAVLVDEASPAFLMGAFDSAVSVGPAVDKLEDAFRSGVGMSYDEHGPSCACAVERMGAFTKNHRLIPQLIPMVEGMSERLQSGIRVADVGCGGALSTIAMAQSFPASSFVGYDISEHALARARANLAESGLSNVKIKHPFETPMADDGPFDFITTFDVIHDTPHPADLVKQIYDVLSDGGVWLCEDIRGFETFEENLARHPLAAMLYGFSVMVCMNSGLSTPDGAGLGTLGFTEGVAREMTGAAGFVDFERLDVDNPMNSYYVLRKRVS